MGTTNKNPAALAAKMSRALQVAADEIDRDKPITFLVTFLAVAAAGDDGIDQGELQEMLQLSSGGVSRVASALADMHYLKHQPGAGLIERATSLKDFRRKILRLTPKGRKVLDRMVTEMAR